MNETFSKWDDDVGKEENKENVPTEEHFEDEEESEKKGESESQRYKCYSCGKDFKFLTYLKGHQSSKANCNSEEIKKKRQSMNVSRICSF